MNSGSSRTPHQGHSILSMHYDSTIPMSERYSFFALARHAVNSRKPRWPRVLQRPTLKKSYDAVIIGGGGHGLATAYFLAKDHGIEEHRRARARRDRPGQLRA